MERARIAYIRGVNVQIKAVFLSLNFGDGVAEVVLLNAGGGVFLCVEDVVPRVRWQRGLQIK